MTVPQKIALVRDQVLFLGGLFGIGYQQVTGNIHLGLLAIFTAMTGVPGLTNLISLVRGSNIAPSSELSERQDSYTDSG